MKSFLFRTTSALLLATFALSANAATVTGTWLSNTEWSLIHAGSGPGGEGSPADYLRWDADQQVIFDLTSTMLTATDPQDFTLTSMNGDTATFTLLNAELFLADADGFLGGTMDYSLEVDSGPLVGSYIGTFTFTNISFAGTPFNSSSIENGEFSIFLWGGDFDARNNIGIDVGISTVVPLPAPLLLFGSALFGLGLTRRNR